MTASPSDAGSADRSTTWSAARPLQIDDLRTHRRRRPVGSLVSLGVLAFIGVSAAGDALQWGDIPVLTVLVVSLLGVAAGALLSSLVNRSWLGVPLALMMAPLVTGLLITSPDLDGGMGDRTVVARSIGEAETGRQLGIGELTLDLSELTPEQLGQGLDIDAEVGIGHLVVIVPGDATLVLETEVGAGDVMLDGFNISDGVRTNDVETIRPTATDGDSTGTIRLDLDVGIGRIDIHTGI